MVKQRTLATDLSRRLGLVKSSFRSNPCSFGSNPVKCEQFPVKSEQFFSQDCGSNPPTYLPVSSQLLVLTAPCVLQRFTSVDSLLTEVDSLKPAL